MGFTYELTDPANLNYRLGTPPAAHHLNELIDFRPCARCGSTNVLVLDAQFCIHPFSGDKYYDYRLGCQVCTEITLCAYAEND